MTYKERLEKQLVDINNKITDLEYQLEEYKDISDKYDTTEFIEITQRAIEDLLVKKDEIKTRLRYA